MHAPLLDGSEDISVPQVVLLRVEDDHVAEYVNGEPELERVERFEIDMEKRIYHDDSGEGRFEDAEDIKEIDVKVKELFAEASRAALTKPKRVRALDSQKWKQIVSILRSCTMKVKNYTKPNILLLGPTGSGKTYLLRNLAAAWEHFGRPLFLTTAFCCSRYA